MNKLMGFYELKNMRLPSVQWKEYTGKEVLREDILWTIRSAVFDGADLNLPRLVGATSKEAEVFAKKLFDEMQKGGIVIYYPYFFASKSGTLNVYRDKIVIEAVKADLWNLVTFSDRDLTIQINEQEEIYDGDRDFLSKEKKGEILSYVSEIRRLFRDDLLEGRSVLLEWSYALNCGVDKKPIGDEYLVFYEARTV